MMIVLYNLIFNSFMNNFHKFILLLYQSLCCVFGFYTLSIDKFLEFCNPSVKSLFLFMHCEEEKDLWECFIFFLLVILLEGEILYFSKGTLPKGFLDCIKE